MSKICENMSKICQTYVKKKPKLSTYIYMSMDAHWRALDATSTRENACRDVASPKKRMLGLTPIIFLEVDALHKDDKTGVFGDPQKYMCI